MLGDQDLEVSDTDGNTSQASSDAPALINDQPPDAIVVRRRKTGANLFLPFSQVLPLSLTHPRGYLASAPLTPRQDSPRWPTPGMFKQFRALLKRILDEGLADAFFDMPMEKDKVAALQKAPATYLAGLTVNLMQWTLDLAFSYAIFVRSYSQERYFALWRDYIYPLRKTVKLSPSVIARLKLPREEEKQKVAQLVGVAKSDCLDGYDFAILDTRLTQALHEVNTLTATPPDVEAATSVLISSTQAEVEPSVLVIPTSQAPDVAVVTTEPTTAPARRFTPKPGSHDDFEIGRDKPNRRYDLWQSETTDSLAAEPYKAPIRRETSRFLVSSSYGKFTFASTSSMNLAAQSESNDIPCPT